MQYYHRLAHAFPVIYTWRLPRAKKVQAMKRWPVLLATLLYRSRQLKQWPHDGFSIPGAAATYRL